jgi:hypothetical protein
VDDWEIPGRSPEKDRRAWQRHHVRRLKARWRARFAGEDEHWRKELVSRHPRAWREEFARFLATRDRVIGKRVAAPRHDCQLCSLRTRRPEFPWRDEALLELALASSSRILPDLGRRARSHFPRVDARPRIGGSQERFRPWLSSGSEPTEEPT